MFLACDVKGETEYKCHDYPKLFANVSYESLVIIQQGGSKINFKWYAILMHMILVQAQKYGVWDPLLNVRHVQKGIKVPIQLWISIWDNGYQHSQALVFEQYFVRRIYILLVV